MAAMNRERCRFTLTECGGRLYAVGGSAEDATGDGGIGVEDDCTVEMYDPNSDVWTRMPGLPGGNRYGQKDFILWLPFPTTLSQRVL